MKKNEWYDIIDLSKFIESTRVLVFDNFGKSLSEDQDSESIILNITELGPADIDELNTVLSQEECLIIAKDYVKTTKRGSKINDKKYMEMIECFNGRMVSNMISSLVNKGILDIAYDDKLNDFVFWVTDDHKKKE
jgi:hypothetical protein